MEFSIDDKRLITLGYGDNCMCQFKTKQLFYEESAVSLKRGIDEAAQSQGVQKIVLHPEQDETLILELNYCFQIITRKTDQI